MEFGVRIPFVEHLGLEITEASGERAVANVCAKFDRIDHERTGELFALSNLGIDDSRCRMVHVGAGSAGYRSAGRRFDPRQLEAVLAASREALP